MGMLADPLRMILSTLESVRLLNLSDRVLDAGGWRWGEPVSCAALCIRISPASFGKTTSRIGRGSPTRAAPARDWTSRATCGVLVLVPVLPYLGRIGWKGPVA